MDIKPTLENEEITEIKQHIAQVMHDIKSPLACLRMFIASCSGLLPRDREVLQAIVNNIDLITNNILDPYTSHVSGNYADNGSPIACAAVIEDVIASKRFEYQGRKVQFNYEVSPNSEHDYIQVNSVDFIRMLSNLVNNAVDALGSKDGIISIKLHGNTETVKITIEDNGKGMPAEVMQKILNKEVVTAGKANGHGLGMAQVTNTLTRYKGTLSLSSHEGQGTTITLSFPRMADLASVVKSA
jgi:signal transduction histidine kinase